MAAVYYNPTTEPYVVTATAFAASANFAGNLNPSGGAASWVQGGAVTVAPEDFGVTAMASVKSLPRDDGGLGYPIYVGTHTAGQAVFTTWSDLSTDWNIKYPNDRMLAAVQTGDFVTTNQGGFNSVALINNLLVFGMCPLYDVPVFTHLVLGDSLRQGSDDQDGAGEPTRDSYYWLAAREAGALIDVCNVAVGGAKYSEIVARGKKAIAFFKPSILTVPCGTINGSATGVSLSADDLEIQWAMFLDLLSYARSMGCEEIIVEPLFSANNYSTAVRAKAAELRDRVRSMSSSYHVLDVMEILGASDDITRFRNGMAGPDGVHVLHVADQTLKGSVKTIYKKIGL